MGLSLIYGVRLIGREIKSISLESHYKTHELVNLCIGIWSFYLIILTVSIAILLFVGYYDRK